jgi:hypothetical protein
MIKARVERVKERTGGIAARFEPGSIHKTFTAETQKDAEGGAEKSISSLR